MSSAARRTLALAAIGLLTFGCAAHVVAPPPPPPPTSIEIPERGGETAAPAFPVFIPETAAPEEPVQRTLVRFSFATDRAKGNPAVPNEYFLGRQADNLTFGECVVSIPPGHTSGKVERPWSIFGHEFEEKLNDHIVLTAVRESLRANFLEGLRTRMHEAATRLGPLDARDVLVFVHGYNTTFAEAAWRTAQLSHDLRFPGVTLLYSWSSAGDTKAYFADGENARLSAPHLRQLLVDLASVPDTRFIHVVAHSMGNRVVTDALVRLSPAQRLIVNAKLNQIVLAAPDIDARVFEREVAPGIKGVGSRVTLYASSNDDVLILSGKITNFRRAGDSRPAILVVDGVDSIDASAVNTGLGHFPVASVKTVIDDLAALLRYGLPPDRREELMRHDPAPSWWAFRP